MKKDSNTTIIFYVNIHTPCHTAMVCARCLQNAMQQSYLEGWLLNSVQWTSCTNPEGKPTTPMSKRDVADRILTPRIVTVVPNNAIVFHE